MEEKELISQLKKFSQIKAQKNWAALVKKDILGEELKPAFFPVFQLKPALAGVVFVFMTLGLLSTTINSLPGDFLFPIKKAADKGRAIFLAKEDMTTFQLQLANERLEELSKAPAKNLAPGINEFQANLSEAARNLVKMDASTSSPVAIKKLVAEAKKMKENKEKAEALGMVIGEEGAAEFDKAMAKVVDNLITDLESRTLTDDNKEILGKIKGLFEEKKYSEALELYLINQ